MNATESDVSLSTTDPELVTHELTYGDQRLTIANFASDQLINTSLAADGSWEPWQLKLMSRAVRPDFTCVDIGANIGINALFMSRCCPQGRVFAFEPFDRIYAVLRRNVELNHTSNLTAINKGISSKTQSLNMVTDMRSVGGAHIAEPGATGGDVVGGTFHFARLDDELRAQGVDKVDFIKIDVEGHELHVLDSAASFLSNADLQLAIEYNPPLLRITAPDPSVPFVDRRLFDRLRLSFQRMFFMNRDGTLVELADYHALRRCLLGGYFVDDMYCTNHVPASWST
ncbi:MAG TPA: FkbM family methyltransferase [Tepidisphaeraceae bacterium]|nr:FkbM family methyltransferase [Tepidisphaeraceae bacterium]